MYVKCEMKPHFFLFVCLLLLINACIASCQKVHSVIMCSTFYNEVSQAKKRLSLKIHFLFLTCSHSLVISSMYSISLSRSVTKREEKENNRNKTNFNRSKTCSRDMWKELLWVVWFEGLNTNLSQFNVNVALCVTAYCKLLLARAVPIFRLHCALLF